MVLRYSMVTLSLLACALINASQEPKAPKKSYQAVMKFHDSNALLVKSGSGEGLDDSTHLLTPDGSASPAASRSSDDSSDDSGDFVHSAIVASLAASSSLAASKDNNRTSSLLSSAPERPQEAVVVRPDLMDNRQRALIIEEQKQELIKSGIDISPSFFSRAISFFPYRGVFQGSLKDLETKVDKAGFYIAEFEPAGPAIGALFIISGIQFYFPCKDNADITKYKFWGSPMGRALIAVKKTNKWLDHKAQNKRLL